MMTRDRMQVRVADLLEEMETYLTKARVTSGVHEWDHYEIMNRAAAIQAYVAVLGMEPDLQVIEQHYQRCQGHT